MSCRLVVLHVCALHPTIAPQDDLLNGNLTVEETLSYTAQLRLDQTFTEEQRAQRVDEVIKQMGLSRSRNTVVGTPLKKGISGMPPCRCFGDNSSIAVLSIRW